MLQQMFTVNIPVIFEASTSIDIQLNFKLHDIFNITLMRPKRIGGAGHPTVPGR